MAVKSMTSMAAMRTLMCKGRFETHLPYFSLEEVDEQHFSVDFQHASPIHFRRDWHIFESGLSILQPYLTIIDAKFPVINMI